MGGRYTKVQISFPDGDGPGSVLCLNDREIRKLEYHAAEMNAWARKNGYPEHHTAESAIRYGIFDYIKNLPAPPEIPEVKGTPEAAAPGEPDNK